MICIDKKEFQDSGPIQMKLVAVGDGAVGKTCILHRYMNDQYSEEHVPTIFENSYMMVKIDKKTIQLGIWDTAGQEEYNRLRPLSYSNTDIFLIVFSVVDPESFDNALKKWYPELQQVQPKSLKIFVGNKTDLLTSEEYKNRNGKNAPVNSQQVINFFRFTLGQKIQQPYQEGIKLCVIQIKIQKINKIVSELGCQYYECSAKQGTGIKELFLKTIADGIQFKQNNTTIKRERNRCNLI